jgi:hypothetical protein
MKEIKGTDNQFSEEEIRIFNRFPKLFRQANLSMHESTMYWGIGGPPVWLPVVEELAENINEIAEDYVEFAQIKEKWYELRVYVDFKEGATKEIIQKVYELIEEAEDKCIRVKTN